VRELCIFSPHSVIRDPPFRLDLISCRNLLIYFGADILGRRLDADEQPDLGLDLNTLSQDGGRLRPIHVAAAGAGQPVGMSLARFGLMLWGRM
jgi:hypothetical protein